MENLIQNFIGGSGQVVALFAVLALWAGLSVLGSAIAGRNHVLEAAPIYGWALASFALTFFGVFKLAPFTYVSLALLALTPLAGFYIYRRDGRLFAPAVAKVFVLALPLLALASAMVPSQWDEFSNWLPNVRFLVEMDVFPGADNPRTGSSFPAYPYGWTFLSYMASRLAGRFVENAGGILNVMLFLTFGMTVARAVFGALGKSGPIFQGWPIAALAVLMGFAFNPTFSQKIVLTAYADAPSAVVLGIGGVLGWRMLNALAEAEDKLARAYALQFGLAMSVLVNLKQVGLVLFVMAAGGVFLAGAFDPKIRFRRLLNQAPLMTVPAIVVYVLWRYYVNTELPGREFVIQQFSNWNIDLIPQILLKMLSVLSKKGAYLALMAAAVGFAVRGLLRRRDALDRLAVIVGFVFLGYNAFLFFTYVASFGSSDALSVTSFWRYNMHLGLLGVVFGAYGLALLWERRLKEKLNAKMLGRAAVVLALVLPVAFSNKLRFDREPPKPHFLSVAQKLSETLPEGARIVIIDPKGSGESAMMVRYALGLNRRMVGLISAYNTGSLESIRDMLEKEKPDFVLIHSTTPDVLGALSMDLPDGVSHLLVPEGGGWRIQRSWPY